MLAEQGDDGSEGGSWISKLLGGRDCAGRSGITTRGR